MVAVITGLWEGRERSGYRTRYQKFVGWTYDHQAGASARESIGVSISPPVQTKAEEWAE